MYRYYRIFALALCAAMALCLSGLAEGALSEEESAAENPEPTEWSAPDDVREAPPFSLSESTMRIACEVPADDLDMSPLVVFAQNPVELSWSSSNPEVAKFADASAILEILGYGQTTIRVKCSDNSAYYAELKLTVEPKQRAQQDSQATSDEDASAIAIKSQSGEFFADAGGQLQLSADVRGTLLCAQWTSLNEDIAVVRDGLVTAIREGTATISVECQYSDGGEVFTAQAWQIITVGRPRALLIQSASQTGTLLPGGTLELTATLNSATAEDVAINWSSSDSSVATVEGGLVLAHAAGGATITATCEYREGGVFCSSSYSYPIWVSGLYIVKGENSLAVGGELLLKTGLIGIDLQNAGYTWVTSGAHIARVDANGLVTGVEEGAATITVICDYYQDGVLRSMSAQTEVRVVAPIHFEIIAEDGALHVGGEVILSVHGGGIGLEGYSIEWGSWNEQVATVDANGVVTGVAGGNATLAARIEYSAGGEIYTNTLTHEITVIGD